MRRDKNPSVATVCDIVACLTGKTPAEARRLCTRLHPDMPVVVPSDPEGNGFHAIEKNPDAYATGDWDAGSDGYEKIDFENTEDAAAEGCARVFVLWVTDADPQPWQEGK